MDIPKINYTGSIKETELGKGDKAVKVGGETIYPFHLFEGSMPNVPKIAIEVYDCPPEDWAPAALEPYKDVVNDPVAWAKKCVNDYGAEIVALQLTSIDPNGLNRSTDEATQVVKSVADAIDVPLIVWGCADETKDEETLRNILEVCEDKRLIVGPLTEKNYKRLGAGAIGFNHTVIASTPIDINLAKQLNILLDNLGVPEKQIVMDPTTGGLGYGIEYTYSVMERLKMAALTQGDDKLQVPMVCNLAKEVWKCKEAKQSAEEAPLLGDPKSRGILMEAMTAMLLILGGANILIMRHPEAINLIRWAISEFS
ncbi:MAG: acetyl-CoA decarbonylase/synthase complex subunit delta [Thermodesulfobacteriota bacterium]|nr:acetyl-CoA decarbonylase/synthase complex subunit delta [Thermodesulfobacteriota bacterium]